METTLLKVPEVARRLSISRAKVYELLAGELRSVRLAGSRRARSVDLDDFIAGLDESWPQGAYARGSLVSVPRRP